MNLNHFTRDCRRAHGYTQREFAAKLGVDFVWLSKLENGRIELGDSGIGQVIEPLAQFANYNADWLRSLPVVQQTTTGEPAFICRVEDMAPKEQPCQS